MKKVDQIDFEILSLLQEDARMSYSAIARHVHLSVTAVTSRIQRMEDDQVLTGFRAQINGDHVGLRVHGFILAGAWQIKLDAVHDYLATLPEVVRVETIISGGKELLIEFYCADMDALMKFYESGLRDYLETMTVYLVKDPPAKNSGLPLSLSAKVF